MTTYDAWLAEVSELPALPMAVTRLLTVLDTPSSSAKDIAKVIETDPALAVKVLRLANSAAFAVGESVGSVHRATVLLGQATLKGMAISHGLYACLDGPNRDLLDRHFWGHSIAAAIGAHEIARRTHLPEASDAFITGLLHDIGQVLLAYWFNADYRALLREHHAGSIPLAILEHRRFGAHHGQLGALLLRTWGLPAAVANAVEAHHELYKAPIRIKRLTALAEVAHTAAVRMGYYGLSDEAVVPTYGLGAQRILRTTPALLEEVEQLIVLEVPRCAGLIQLRPPPPHSVSLLPNVAA